jgi:peroxiredoxin
MAAGATLVAISPQLEEYNRKITEQNHLTFDVLSDRGNQVAGRFGLAFKLPDDLRALYEKFGADLARFNGDDSWTLPMPGRFVIDGGSIIRSAEVDPDYTVRPEPSATVAALQTLRARAK